MRAIALAIAYVGAALSNEMLMRRKRLDSPWEDQAAIGGAFVEFVLLIGTLVCAIGGW